MSLSRAAWFASLLLGLMHQRVAAEITMIDSDAAFEQTVMNDPHCWAILFTSKTRPEEVAPLLRSFEQVEARLGDVRLGVADVDVVKAVSSEFNVRKRMVPRIRTPTLGPESDAESDAAC